MKQGLWTGVLIALVVVIVVVGFFAAQSWSKSNAAAARADQLAAQVQSLTSQVNQLQQGSSANQQSFKVAYVDMFQVLQQLRDSDPVKQALSQYQSKQAEIQQQIDALDQQLKDGKISQSTHDSKVQELTLQLDQVNLQLSAPIQQQMVKVIQQIGEANGYSMVIDNPASQYNAIVLYHQNGQADDITSQVIDQLSKVLQQNASQSSSSK